jgi:hypothetical protein
MCSVWTWKNRLAAKYRAPCFRIFLISFNYPTIPMICAITFATDLYLSSALTLNWDTLGCFLELHEIRLDLRKTSWQHVDPQSYGQPALENPLIIMKMTYVEKAQVTRSTWDQIVPSCMGLNSIPRKKLSDISGVSPYLASIWAHTPSTPRRVWCNVKAHIQKLQLTYLTYYNQYLLKAFFEPDIHWVKTTRLTSRARLWRPSMQHGNTYHRCLYILKPIHPESSPHNHIMSRS